MALSVRRAVTLCLLVLALAPAAASVAAGELEQTAEDASMLQLSSEVGVLLQGRAPWRIPRGAPWGIH